MSTPYALTEIKMMDTHYYMTQYRIVEVLGILRKKKHALQMPQIESIKIHQSFFERLFNVGDIEIKTAREVLVLYKVGNPRKVESLIMGELQKSMTSQPQRPGI